jgi:uncharacterized protein YdhG (YjbR/CyaY superfamily)
MNTKATSIDEFISTYPKEIQAILQKTRQIIQRAAPDATEKIGYGIPTFTFHGNLVHFSAYPTHIGFYPGPATITAFQDELKPYDTAKGTIRFPLDRPIPYDLIEKITKYNVAQRLK